MVNVFLYYFAFTAVYVVKDIKNDCPVNSYSRNERVYTVSIK